MNTFDSSWNLIAELSIFVLIQFLHQKKLVELLCLFNKKPFITMLLSVLDLRSVNI